MLRALGTLCCLVLAAGCAGPHSTGALWSVQNVDRERALGRLTAADQADKMQALEFGVADEALASERARLNTALSACPGVAEPLTASAGDRTRDVIRLQAMGDAARLDTVAQLALADWRIRRARATGDTQFCDAARTALAGTASPTASNLPDQSTLATVTRGPYQVASPTAADDPTVALSEYVLGYVDTVSAPAPLPQYLAFVYGGRLAEGDGVAALDAETAAEMVDREAPAYPQWEPDALYAALTGGKT